MLKRIAVYPGSFDPITNGHLDILSRTAKIFDEVHLVLGYNFIKKSTFSVEERLDMLNEIAKNYHNVKVTTFNGMMIDYAKSVGATAIIRGLRALNDFDYEFQIAMMNQDINSDIEMLFLMSKKDNTFLSSSLIKELALHHQNVERLVPSIVNKYLVEKYQ